MGRTVAEACSALGPHAVDTFSAVGDVAGVGRPSLIFTNQHEGITLCRMPLPGHPTVSPWRLFLRPGSSPNR